MKLSQWKMSNLAERCGHMEMCTGSTLISLEILCLDLRQAMMDKIFEEYDMVTVICSS